MIASRFQSDPRRITVLKMKKTFAFLVALLSSVSTWAQDGGIVHDSEYRFLAAQHGEKWAAQDGAIDARLAEMRQEL